MHVGRWLMGLGWGPGPRHWAGVSIKMPASLHPSFLKAAKECVMGGQTLSKVCGLNYMTEMPGKTLDTPECREEMRKIDTAGTKKNSSSAAGDRQSPIQSQAIVNLSAEQTSVMKLGDRNSSVHTGRAANVKLMVT